MPLAVRSVLNPSNADQLYILWDKGRVQQSGSDLPPVVPQDSFTAHESGSATGSAPLVPAGHPLHVVAIQITDWAGPEGYTLSDFGHTFAFGGATEAPRNTQPIESGIYPAQIVVDFVMNPNGDGTGYALLTDGTLRTVGGAVDIESIPIPGGGARRIYMFDWVTKEYWIVDVRGRGFARHGAPTIATPGFAAGAVLWNEDRVRASHFYNADGDGWGLEKHGFVFPWNDAQTAPGYRFDALDDWATDLVVFDDGLGADPLHIGVLSKYGFIHDYIVSTAPSVQVVGPEDPTTLTTRPDFSWIYSDAEGDAQDAVQVRVFTDAQYLAGSPVNQVQTITITGSPTGGFFKLRLPWSGEQTADIAHNANAAAVLAALEALPSIEVGDVACAGGALPATPVTVTFQARLGAHSWPVMTATDTMTGGTTPTATPSITTAGVGIDPETAADPVWERDYGSESRQIRAGQIDDEDLPDDTYRIYIRAQDTSGLWSLWAYAQWEQDVTLPATPTLVATPVDDLSGVLLDVDAASVVSGGRFGVQYRDDAAEPWRWVRAADALVPDGGDHATVLDREIVYGVERTYRAVQYVPDPLLVGAFSTEDTATITSDRFTLVDPLGSGLGVVLHVRSPDLKFSRTVVSGVYDRLAGRPDAVVVTDGAPRGHTLTLPLRAMTKGDYDALENLLARTRTYLLRDPLGRAWYVGITGDIDYLLRHLLPRADETTPFAHLHELELPLTEIARPLAGPTSGALALVD